MSLLGLIILLRNPKQKTNKLFGFLAFSITFWTVFNMLSGGTSLNVLVSRLVFLGGVLTAFSLLLFTMNFPKDNILAGNILQKIIIIFSVLMCVIVFLPGFIDHVTVDSLVTSYLYPVFIVYSFLGLLSLIYIMLKQVKHAEEPAKRQQAVLLTWGIILYAALALLTNVILPLFIKSWSSSKFGPVFSLFLVAVVAYSIVKHKLFDIRFVIVRSLGYILSLALIAFISTITLVNITNLLSAHGVNNNIQNIISVVSTLILALLYQPFKNTFDKLTKKLFYRDAYETQDLLNEFNETIVSTINLEQLLKRAGVTIEKYLKPVYCDFAINDREAVRIVPSRQTSLPKEELEKIKSYAHKLPKKLLVTDDLEVDMSKLKNALTEAGVGLLIRITSDPSAEGTGYILLGYKKSGNTYNSQDTEALEIVASELAIAMQNALQFEEIQQFNITLQQKVDDATHKLRQTNEKLKQLDATKDDFISMASHQLRTPLTSVKGYVSMVLDEDAGKVSPQQRKLLDQAFISSQRMVYLIADLLNVSRLKTGKFVIEAKPTNLAEVVGSELEQLKETAKGRGLKLLFERPKKFPEMNLDETKIRQVIMNFSDNAIYYTPTGGTITVGLQDKPDSVELTVSDNGIGVPKAMQHHLFTKFYRADNAKKARPDGTGLGLFMAQKVIVASGGSIIFHSEENKGSTFGFSFPKSKLLVK
jgi:signal transduction histidine kinase